MWGVFDFNAALATFAIISQPTWRFYPGLLDKCDTIFDENLTSSRGDCVPHSFAYATPANFALISYIS